MTYVKHTTEVEDRPAWAGCLRVRNFAVRSSADAQPSMTSGKGRPLWWTREPALCERVVSSRAGKRKRVQVPRAA